MRKSILNGGTNHAITLCHDILLWCAKQALDIRGCCWYFTHGKLAWDKEYHTKAYYYPGGAKVKKLNSADFEIFETEEGQLIITLKKDDILGTLD